MKTALVFAALCAASTANAATPIDGWYSSVFGGYTYLPSNVHHWHFGTLRSDPSYDGGYDAGGSIGYKSNPMRYEGELTYLNAQTHAFRVNSLKQTGVKGNSDAVLAMANIYYDFPEMVASIQPFLGMGIGYAWVGTRLDSSGPFGLTGFTGSNNVFAYQATTGLTYNFSENYALNIGYRYAVTGHASALGRSFQAHMANVGAIYRFSENRYK